MRVIIVLIAILAIALTTTIAVTQFTPAQSQPKPKSEKEQLLDKLSATHKAAYDVWASAESDPTRAHPDPTTEALYATAQSLTATYVATYLTTTAEATPK